MDILVLLSGGLDSTTCLAKAVEEHGKENVTALCAFYGQKHEKEKDCAKAVAEHYGVNLLFIDLQDVMQYSDSALLQQSDKEIEHSSYDEQTDGKTPVSTYVPFRNGVMLSCASAIGMSIGAKEVWYGAHADDAAGAAYPDCSVSFVDKMRSAIDEGTANAITIVAPYVEKNKADIVADGLRLHVPYELTWSCYEGGDKPCGKCATCIDRKKAFELNGAKDPLLED